MSLFGDISLDEFSDALRSAIASFGGRKPPDGYEQLRMQDLGIDQSGTTFTSRSGRGKAIVVQQDQELIVASRGTDRLNDLLDYDNISVTRNYYRQFEPLLEHVADYAGENQLHVTFTGASLGGAVANIIADHADQKWGRAFADSDFIGISSPYLSHNRKVDLLNFGFGNDIVYHIVPGSWTDGTRAMATKNVFLYENHRFLRDDNLDDRVSPHHLGNYADAIETLAGITLDDGRMLSEALSLHSFVIFDHTREKLQAGRLQHPVGTTLTVIGESRNDRLYGASHHVHGGHNEWFFGEGGNDRVVARSGSDQLYGGGGNDLLIGGEGVDYASGGAGRDSIYLEDDHDRASGGIDSDTFIIRNVLPKNDSGHFSPWGNHAPQLFIDDFQAGTDVLNLRGIDGDLGRKGDQKLHFAGYERYDTSDGLNDLEKGYVNDATPGSVTIFLDKSGDTLVIVNRDGDRGREMEILLAGDVGDIHRDLFF